MPLAARPARTRWPPIGQVEADLRDARVVRVQQRAGACWHGGERRLDFLRDRLELAIAIELVAEQVGHDHHPRRRCLHHRRETGLVDLEDADLCSNGAVKVAVLDDRRRQAGEQVGPCAVAHDARPRGLEEGAQQARRSGLAVGPGDHQRPLLQAMAEFLKGAPVDAGANAARQRRASSPAKAPDRARCQLAGRDGRGEGRVHAPMLSRRWRRPPSGYCYR